jgi:hypothetical protein
MSDFTVIGGWSIPAGNGVATWFMEQFPLGNCNVEEFQINFPPGCAGLVGAKIWAGGGPAYPNDQANFFVFDGYTYVQEVSNQINNGDWAIQLYNMDYVPHIVRVLAKCNYLVVSPSGGFSPAISL